MKKLSTITVFLMAILTESVFAMTPVSLNNVSYQLTERQWVKTTKAVAVVSISATVSDQNIASLRQSILKNLQTIAAGDWHITEFTQSKTSSGLESVNARAQIRLPAEQLNEINSRVKNVSKAGQTYTVAGLSFNPSPSDIMAVQSALRKKIYKDIQDELNRLNQQFPNANYFVHQIRFISGQITPRAVTFVRTTTKKIPSVSKQETLTAEVVLSSKINGLSSSTANNG